MQTSLNLKPKNKSVNLSMTQNFEVIKLINESYAVSGKSDAEFAIMLTEELGYEVKASHIATRRKEFGVEANLSKYCAKSNRKDGYYARIEQLESEMKIIKAQLRRLENGLEC
jgi:hypothetical protein